MPTTPTSSLIVSLVKAAQLLTAAMFARTDTDEYPKTKTEYDRTVYSIKDATTIRPPTTRENTSTIQILIDVTKAPYAKAYEWGVDSPYPIPSGKNKKALAFHWTPERIPWGSPKFIGFADDGRYLFKNVEHPFIRKLPYIAPSIQETREAIKKTIGQEFIASITSNQVTVIKVGFN